MGKIPSGLTVLPDACHVCLRVAVVSVAARFFPTHF